MQEPRWYRQGNLSEYSIYSEYSHSYLFISITYWKYFLNITIDRNQSVSCLNVSGFKLSHIKTITYRMEVRE